MSKTSSAGGAHSLTREQEKELKRKKKQGKKGSRSEKKGHGKRRALIALLVVLAAVVVLAAAAAIWLYNDDAQRITRVPEQTTLDGEVDVSGMSADELEETIRSRVDDGSAGAVELTVAGETYTVELADVCTVDVDSTVEDAFAPYGTTVYERCFNRVRELVTGEQESYEVSTYITPRKKAVRKLVKGIAKELDEDAVDADYAYENDGLVVTKESDGLEVKVKPTVEAVMAAIEGLEIGETVEVEGTSEVLEGATDPGQAIYVNTTTCELYLYESGEVTFNVPCSPGMDDYETPTGDFYLSYKELDPTWVNPGSDWAKDMPDTIEPGDDNPMGRAKLALSYGNGIFIHGTNNLSALGSRDSHGCIRIANDNVVKLYHMVEVGIPIIVRE